MNRIRTIRLAENCVRRLIDGLDVLIEEWESTRDFHECGYVPEHVIVRECKDAKEAEAIAASYRRIRSSIEKQLNR